MRLDPPVVALISAVIAAMVGALLLAWLRARRHLARARAAADRASLDRMAATGSLREELDARDTVLAAMSEGVWLIDPEGRLAYANSAARTIVRRRIEGMSDVAPRSLRETILEVHRGSGRGGGRESATRTFETAGGAVEATALAASPPGSVVVTLRDITRARYVERLRRDFVANASHELKTPVASILALSGALRAAAGSDPEAEARFLTRLDHEAERLAALVRDLLELSRLEEGAGRRSAVRLDRVVAAEAERSRWRAERAGLRLGVDVDGPLLVSGSSTELAHLVQNLLDNAVRYTPSGGEIRVSVDGADGMAQVSVRDTGIGIPSRDLDRVFERFYRADAARSRETGGTGLGLSIVRHIAEAHGGTVRCQSVLGAGTTLITTLPLLTGAAASSAAKEEAGAPEGAPASELETNR